MTVRLTHEIFASLIAEAERRGTSPAAVARAVLSEHLPPAPDYMPRDDWERRLREIATDCGVALSDDALSREELYD